MNEQCEECLENLVDCVCPKEKSVFLRDEVRRAKSVAMAIQLLVEKTDHKLYHPDPCIDLFEILYEKLDLMDKELK